MESQSGLFIAALMSAVTYAWLRWTLAGGWSLSAPEGMSQLTAGRVPFLAACR